MYIYIYRQRLINSPEYISAAERPGRARYRECVQTRRKMRLYAYDRLCALRTKLPIISVRFFCDHISQTKRFAEFI